MSAVEGWGGMILGIESAKTLANAKSFFKTFSSENPLASHRKILLKDSLPFHPKKFYREIIYFRVLLCPADMST
jgi:hypothetical protein